MAIKVQNGGVWKTLTGCKVFATGAWRDAAALRIRAGGSWRLVTFATSGSGMSVSISPSPFAFVSGGAKTSGFLTATPSAGVSPFSYTWTITADSKSGSLTGAGFATVTANSDNLNQAGDTETMTLRCDVTDSLGNTAHADVSGTFHHS